MADVISCTPFVEWTTELCSSISSDANRYTVVYKQFVKDFLDHCCVGFLGIGAAIGHPEYLSMPIR